MPSVLFKSKGLLSLEMIDFQNDSFGSDIELIVSKIKEDIDSNTLGNNKQVEDSVHVKNLSTLIEKRLGLKTKFIVNNYMLAAVMPFYSNKNHIFIHKVFRGEFTIKEQQAILKESNNKKGYVDSAKAKVGGIYGEYVNPVYISFIALFNMGMSSSEVTAIILHELGHAFYVCEYADRLESNNQILANVARQLHSNKADKNMTHIFKELKSINDEITEEDVDALVNGTRVVAGVKWFKLLVGSVDKQLSQDKYDETSFEQLADNFASRFKYGRSLITGLDKLSKAYSAPEKSRGMRIYLMTLEAIYFVYSGMLMGSIALGFTMFLPFVMGALLFSLALSIAGEKNIDYTYDSLRVRYKRIRNEMVELLKSDDLETKEIKTILESIRISDRTIEETGKYKSIFNMLANFLIPSNRKAKNSIVEQQVLEELAFNDLFIKSAELKTLA